MNEPNGSFHPGRDFALALDRDDPLGRFREEFRIPKNESGEEEIYFAGNSLGLMPKRTPRYVVEEMEKSGAFATASLVTRNLAHRAAAFVVDHDAAAPPGQRRLFTRVAVDDTDTEHVRAGLTNLRRLSSSGSTNLVI